MLLLENRSCRRASSMYCETRTLQTKENPRTDESRTRPMQREIDQSDRAQKQPIVDSESMAPIEAIADQNFNPKFVILKGQI